MSTYSQVYPIFEAVILKKVMFRLIFFCTILATYHASNIWFLMPMGSRSHKNVFSAIVYELGSRGHEVTFFNPFEPKTRKSNVTEVIFEEGGSKVELAGQTMWKQMGKNTGVSDMLSTLLNISKSSCESFLTWEKFRPYLNGEMGKPDLIMVTLFLQDCLLIVPHKLNVPFVYVSPAGLLPTTLWTVGFRPIPSFMPTPAIGPFTDDMSFLQRTLNFVILNAFGVVMDLFYYPWVDEILTRENGGVELTAKSLMKEASLFFLNIIPAMELPAPKPPVIVDVGGMHCRSGKPVPKEYDDWIRKQKNGFIYFSLGSAVKGKDMPERFRVLFLNVFRELKQYQILWKWESEMADTPSNVKVSSWMPQQDLLARSDIKLFITHGGLLSIQESTYHSVPVVGIAVGADQMLNMKKVEHSEAGLAMTWDEITEEKLLHAIRTVIGDPSFKHNVSRMSAIMKDELEGPLDRAVFWTEYVIRHQGAHHLKSAARNLSWFQYHSIDVIAFLSLCSAMALLIVFVLLKTCCQLFFGRRNISASKEKCD